MSDQPSDEWKPKTWWQRMLYPVFVVAVLASLVVGGARWAWEEATKPPKPETAEHKISRAQTACTMALSTTERVDTVTKLLRLR